MIYELFDGHYTRECDGLKDLKDTIIKDIQSKYSITRLRVDPNDGDWESDIDMVIKDIKFKLEKKK